MFWRLAAEAGLPPSRRDRIEAAATMLALGALLIAANLFATVEVAGLLALGPPLLWQVRHRILRPGAMRAAAPYLALSAVLLASRLVPAPRRR